MKSPETGHSKSETATENASEDDTKSEKKSVFSSPDASIEQSQMESNNNDQGLNEIKKSSSNNDVDLNEKCDTCGQFLNNSDIIYYQGHPQDAVEEFIALTNEKLVLASGKDLFYTGPVIWATMIMKNKATQQTTTEMFEHFKYLQGFED